MCKSTYRAANLLENITPGTKMVACGRARTFVTSSLAMLIATEETDCAKDPVGFGNNSSFSLQKNAYGKLNSGNFCENDFLRKPQTFPVHERKVIYGITFCICHYNIVSFDMYVHKIYLVLSMPTATEYE